MLKKLPKTYNIKKVYFFIIFILALQNSSLADDIRDFKIEGMSIGDSALNYFNESELQDNEQGWHNYSYKEYSTSLMQGNGIYDWFLVSYKSDDDNFIIEALVGGMEKTNYDNKECISKLDSAAINISKKLKKVKQNKKKTYVLKMDASRKYPFTGKSNVTNLSFNFLDEGKIILSCYNMDKKSNQDNSFIKSILSQKDSFRINIRSGIFVNYLKNKE
jgi:hypothetical protein